jgi:hypothetical protein
MSCICGFATIATLIVLAVLLADAAATKDVAITADPMARATASVFRLRALPARLFCMVTASSEEITGHVSSAPDKDLLALRPRGVNG